ncbi:MAG TPA: hypothetical protein VGT99_07610 [Gammaproteobacteria bacterium]|nr:hypothetical protein [Gammaproteobacteria bacterium]
MAGTDESADMAARSRLWLVPMLAAISYPLFLRSAFGSMQMYASAQTGCDRFAALFMFSASLAAAFAVPLTAALWAGRIARSSPDSPAAVRAYRLAHLAFAAPPLFTAFGVYAGVLGLASGMPGIGGLDFPAWMALWLGLGLYCALAEPGKPRIEARPPNRGLVASHGVLALTVLLLFLVAHLGNHLLALWSPALHTQAMKLLETVYRAMVIEPVLVLCMLLLAATGLALAWRHTAMHGDAYRRVQTLTGVYLAAFIVSHLTAILVLARWLSHVRTNEWAYVSSAPVGMLRDAWNVRLIPHYAVAVWAVATHVGLGLRGVLRAHGVAERLGDSLAKGMSALGATVSILIMVAVNGLHLGVS